MAQPKDLGEIRALVQSAPSFKPGEYCYIAIWDGMLKELYHGLFEIQTVGVIKLEVRQIGSRRGLAVQDENIEVPVWATLGKALLQ